MSREAALDRLDAYERGSVDARVWRLLARPEGLQAYGLLTVLHDLVRVHVFTDARGHIPKFLVCGLDRDGALAALVACGFVQDLGEDGAVLIHHPELI